MFAGEAVRESNYYFTPNRRRPGTLVVNRAVFEIYRGAGRLQNAARFKIAIARPRPKKEKSPAKPRWKSKRGVICGRFPSDFR
jgi:hypothetical protein